MAQRPDSGAKSGIGYFVFRHEARPRTGTILFCLFARSLLHTNMMWLFLPPPALRGTRLHRNNSFCLQIPQRAKDQPVGRQIIQH